MNPFRRRDNHNNRTWLQAGLALSAVVVGASPFTTQDLPVPRAVTRPVGQLTWVQSGLALSTSGVIASPVVPVDLPVPRAAQRSISQLTWTQSGLALNTGVVGAAPFIPSAMPNPIRRTQSTLHPVHHANRLPLLAGTSTNVTVYPNGDGSIGNWTAQDSNTTNLWATVDEPTASPNDVDYIMSTSVASTVFLLLGDMPSDFLSMGATIVVKFRGRQSQRIADSSANVRSLQFRSM